jgi:iron complex transport system ATP-binding protein
MAVISLEGVSVGYGRTRVLSGVDLAPIPSGAMVGILGPNGAGKSTLLRAIAGLIPHEGEIRLDGRRLGELAREVRTRRTGYLPQTQTQPSSLVAYEAVLSACRATRPDLSTAAADAAVEEAFERLDIKNLTFIALNKLSGGQRQLVGLAQVIVRKPAVLLFDEPTSALDLRRQLAVFDVARRVMAESAGLCLLALHDINLAMRHCDRLLVLGGGGVLAFGPREIAATPEILRRAFAVEGRVEACSRGHPIFVTDDVSGGDATRA